jgi:hypothetical protein
MYSSAAAAAAKLLDKDSLAVLWMNYMEASTQSGSNANLDVSMKV